jgi:glycosyltransferase involved in cell wall biosynthesis
VRILIVTQHFWPEHFRVNDLADGLVERGHEVTVLTGSPNYPNGDFYKGYRFFNRPETRKGIKILRVPLIPRGSGRSLRLILNYLSFMVSATLAGPFLCQGEFDLIFVFQVTPVTVGIPAAFLRRLKRAPVIFWVLDLWPESVAAASKFKAPSIIKSIDLMVRFIYRRCDRILYTSKGFAGSIQSRGVEPSKLSYFPNWVEPIPGIVGTPPVDLPRGFRILFAGNVGEAQDFGTILEAAERLKDHPEIQWIILGEGRQWNWVKDQVETRGLSACVHLLGRFPADTMPSFFAQADALLVTLKRDPVFALTVPGKVPSYLACGRPILAALDGEGAAVVAEAQAGFVVPSGDAPGLADRALDMSRLSEGERSEMGRSGRQYCYTHFDREKLFSLLESHVQELAGNANSRPRTRSSSHPAG